MKGKYVVIGLVIFVLLVVAAIYLSVMLTFKKDSSSADSYIEGNEYLFLG